MAESGPLVAELLAHVQIHLGSNSGYFSNLSACTISEPLTCSCRFVCAHGGGRAARTRADSLGQQLAELLARTQCHLGSSFGHLSQRSFCSISISDMLLSTSSCVRRRAELLARARCHLGSSDTSSDRGAQVFRERALACANRL
eukprot:1145861-Pelagomonas_calceolata.AAC.1